MKFSYYVWLAIRNFRKKKLLMSVLFISISFAFILFGLNFNKSVDNYWNKSVTNLIDYRTYLTYYDYEKYTETEAINELYSIKHIVSVSPYSSYLINLTSNDFKKKESSVLLIGVPKNEIEVIGGITFKDYNENINPIICPDTFKPYINKSGIHLQENIPLSKYVNKKLSFSFINNNEENIFKLIGVYDSKLNQMESNVCYTTTDIVSSLNMKYQPDAYESKEGIYYPLVVVLDNIKNSEETLEVMSKKGFTINEGGAVLKLDTSSGDKIFNCISITVLIVSFLFLIMDCIFMVKYYKSNSKNYFILKSLGFNNKLYIINIMEMIFLFLLTSIFGICMEKIIETIFSIFIQSKIAVFSNMVIVNNIMNYIICELLLIVNISIIIFIINKKISKLRLSNFLKG